MKLYSGIHKKSVDEAINGFSGFAVLVRVALGSPLEVGTMAFKALLPEVGIGISF